MKTLLLLISISFNSFCDGWVDGYVAGYRQKNNCQYCTAIAPVCGIPQVGQSYESYQDGYNSGFAKAFNN